MSKRAVGVACRVTVLRGVRQNYIEGHATIEPATAGLIIPWWSQFRQPTALFLENTVDRIEIKGLAVSFNSNMTSAPP